MLLDLFPLNTVVFPYQELHLQIFEPRYLALIESCFNQSKPFGVCLIQEGDEVGAPSIPCQIGTSVTIKDFSKVALNLFHIKVQGEKRFKVNRIVQEQPHIQAEMCWIDNKLPVFKGDYQTLRSIVKKLINANTAIPDNKNEFFGFLGTILSLNAEKKQEILGLPTCNVIAELTKFMQSM